ncbi:MAG: glycosyltransferase family 2 protein [Mycobacterium sp.]|nr:glycosyltransferase family 2 protein [Mycobacterium sp.]
MRELSIFLPAYNEEGNVQAVVQRALSVADEVGFDRFEVIVVDDGSGDATGELAEGLAAADARVRVVHHDRNRGYGAALRTGLNAARFEWVFWTDCDGQFDLDELPLLAAPAEHHDLVVGYRVDRQDNFVRRTNTWAWGMLVSRMFDLEIRDVDCAFKLLRRSWLDRIAPLESDGAFASTELLVKLRQAGLQPEQVPVTHLPRRWGTASGADIRVIFRAFRDLFRLRLELAESGKASVTV